jgi:poly(hydroxyalkanoate) depolymerase family esterase
MENIMKPYEQFVANILRAAGTARHDPSAVSGMVQDALREAGLVPGAPAPAQAGGAGMVDLNQAPAWARKSPSTEEGAGPDTSFGAGFGTVPGFGAGQMPDWAAKFKAFQGGHAKARAPRDTSKEPGEFLQGSFSNEAGERNYRLYVPARAASGPRPLVVMLHGCTQNPDDFAAGTAMNALAEEHGCLVLYPEQPRGANANACWNWFEASHQQQGQGEPAILAGMTREMLREHGGDPGRVYVAGLSAGGAMAAILGTAYPELYAAVGVHSGLAAGSAHDLMSALNAMKGAHGKKRGRGTAVRGRIPAIVFHGDCDGTVHPSNGEAVLRQFTGSAKLRETEERGQDASGRSHTRTVTLDGDGRPVAEYWVLHGAGHAWSGGSSAGSYADEAGPNASAEMLRFFLGQQR